MDRGYAFVVMYWWMEEIFMLKIFLVEDEIVVREGIKNNINWEEHGFLFCGEASDGELAYPLIGQLKPDIVITDIRMPFMDGLELSRLLKKEMPWIKIIILSGYGEFEYAKEAINIGVTEYLLKPLSGAELMKSMKVIQDNIKKEQEEKENLEKFKRDMKENEVDEKRKLFHDLVNNTKSIPYIIEKGKELNIELSAVAYNVVLFKINWKQIEKNGYNHILIELKDKLEFLLEEKNEVIKFDCFIEGLALLFKGNSLEDLNIIQSRYIKEMKEILDSYQDISYFGGIGKPVSRLGELPLSYHEASRAFAYRYLWDISEILDYVAISDEIITMKQSSNLGISDVLHLDKKKVEGFLKSGEQEDVDFFVEEYMRSIGNESRNSLLFRQYMVMDMYYIVVGFLEELGYGGESIDEPLKDNTHISLQISSFSKTKTYIANLLHIAIGLREELASNHYNGMIKKAKEYISEHYANEDISLNEVASSVFISPSHFSALFSQKTGQTFVKYLTDMRMNKAKELLKCSDMKTSEIGYSVGYKDPHYFSYIFKKTQNCTPKQYRFCSSQKEMN